MSTPPSSSSVSPAGALSAAGAFLIWGTVPVYWKQMQGVAAPELIAHRIVWSLLFLLGVVAWQRNFAALRPGLGRWIFGCDDCQEVCPFNARPLESVWPELSPERGAGAWLPLAEVLALRSDAAFKARFAGTALLRAKRAGLVRNACVVARNLGAVAELKGLLAACRDRDESPVVREHAAWALGEAPGPQGLSPQTGSA